MPILDEHSLDFISHSPEQTRRLGVRLGELLKPGDLVLLAGDLGAGKTTFAQCRRGWGSLTGHQPHVFLVNSTAVPTRRACFISTRPVDGPAEAVSLGLQEMIGRSALLTSG
jgi:tRNA threonylcarbamoyladenosine biosynthesis protein TsaE